MSAKRTVVGIVGVAVAATACGGTDTAPPPESTVTSSIATSPSAVSTTPVAQPPFIERVAWASTPEGPSLQVFPTESGRQAQAQADMTTAWREVLAFDRTANTPGMQAQFDCHWKFARIVDPAKTSWNLEPWRPVVSESEMVAQRCNPGGAEETLPTSPPPG